MRDALFGLVTHLRVRLRAVVTDPESLVILVGFGLAAALTPHMFARIGRPPGSLPASDGASFSFNLLGAVGWLWGWASLPAFVAAGRSTAGPGGTPFSTRALPSLPVGPRSRALAELIVVMLMTTAALLPLSLLLTRGDLIASASRVGLSLLLLAPSVLAWAMPSRSPGMTMARPFLVALTLVTLTSFGGLRTPLGLTATGVALAATVLAVGEREPSWRRSSLRRTMPVLSRPPLAPESRLSRDVWEQPARLFGPFTAAAAVVLALAFWLNLEGRLPVLLLFVASELVLIPLVIASLRPFGSELVGMALSGKYGGARGDFLRAASVLPVRRSSVLRGVWLQALVLMTLVWLSVLSLFALHAWLHTGRVVLVDRDGDSLARLLLGFAAIIPCHAGFVLAAAVGDRVRMITSGVAWLAAMHGGPILLLALAGLTSRHEAASIAVHAAVLVTVAVLGGLPPLVHLRRVPAPRELAT